MLVSCRDNSANRITAWYFGRELHARMAANSGLLNTNTKRVDLLVTGCEVSLWVAEQFAADLALVFPNLVIMSFSTLDIIFIVVFHALLRDAFN